MIATFAMRIIITVVRVKNDYKIEPPPLTRGIDVCQVASISLSLLTNLTATCLIGYQAWYASFQIRIRTSDPYL